MSQFYCVIIDHVISVPGNVKEVVNGRNAIGKCYISINFNVQRPELITFGSHIPMQSSIQNNYVSLPKEFQKHLLKERRGR